MVAKNKQQNKTKCPKCKKEIDYLISHQLGSYGRDVKLEDGVLRFIENGNESFGWHGEDKFQCPECKNIIFKDEKKALNFLRRKSE